MTVRAIAGRFLQIALCASLSFAAPQPTLASGDSLDKQRELFRRVYADVELGNWTVVDALAPDERRLLESYVLWPDLRSTWLKATIKHADRREIETFLDRFGTLRPARELRYKYALHLARTGNLTAYLDIYRSYYQGIAVARLDCLALQAELETGRDTRVVNRAIDLWLVGKSQVDECDPVFEWIRENGQLSAAEYRQRFDLAIEAREFRLAKFLARAIDERHVAEASLWLSAQNNPERFLRGRGDGHDGETARERIVYAVERLTYRDPVLADELWTAVRDDYAFGERQIAHAERHIALWMARDRLPGAYRALHRLPQGAHNDEVARWRARTSLRAGDWPTLIDDIALLSDAEKESEEWRYWHAYALDRSDRPEMARQEYELLAGERSYYGFLAADETGTPYALDHADLQPVESVIEALATKPAIVRARELFYVGLDSRGRSEWDNAVAYLSKVEQAQAAILAFRWGWHSRAIATAAKVGEYDDLELRYPLAFHEMFERSAEQASIPSTWAYGIARSESLFMRDVRSRAGAVGLMQLMPATGKQVARKIRLPYEGVVTLTNPESNIRLGTSYLGEMAARYGGNRVLATAAYNAGPHRVDKWLPEQESLDARVWIENIPFNETRKYVRRVLAAETIFHWRMTGDVRRLSERLPPVQPRDDALRLASR